MAEQELTISEALNTLTVFGNVFRATEKMAAVLETARQVESNRAAYEAENRHLENVRAELAADIDAIGKRRAEAAVALEQLRKTAADETAALLESETAKREGIIRQTEALMESENLRRIEISAVVAGLEAQRDAVMREIHQLEDRRDELKGAPVSAPSAQVRLPGE